MDDDAIILLANVRGLENLQYEVEAVGDGFVAMELYERAAKSGKPFDVVVLDLIVPCSMGGEETINLAI